MFSQLGAVANLSTLYASVPVLDQPGAAARAGYDAVESWWPFTRSVPSGQEVDDFADAIETAGVELVALNLFLGDPAAGERGILSHPDRVAEFREHVEVVRGLALRLGARLFCAPYGTRRPDLGEREQHATAVANLAHAHRRLGGVPMLEPLSGVPDYPLVTAADAVAVIDRVDEVTGVRGSVGLLADLYHLAANGADIDAVIDAHADRIVHVQLADHPGRHEPGTGLIDFERHLARLRDRGYAGRVALEYVPSR